MVMMLIEAGDAGDLIKRHDARLNWRYAACPDLLGLNFLFSSCVYVGILN